MGASSMPVHHIYASWEGGKATTAIYDSSGNVVCYLRIYATEATDGSLCAQFELRSQDIPMSYIAPGQSVDFARYTFGRSGVVVTVDPPKRFAPAMRFSLHIPSEDSRASYCARYVETPATVLQPDGEAISALRARRGNTRDRANRVYQMAENRRRRELANDRGIAVVGALQALAHALSDPGTRS
jgi:hypothetical protein